MPAPPGGCGRAHGLYSPAAKGRPATSTFVLNAIVVAWSAPGSQARPYATIPPNKRRPRALGRLYTTVTVVVAIVCDTVACWLLRISCPCDVAAQNAASVAAASTSRVAVSLP